jgi:segregation and condensation protein A
MTPAQEAIAKLIDLAQQGEIDPWDVQVIEVIDRFLSEIGIIGNLEARNDRADLSSSGQAFLWASMLVLLKADTLERLQQQEDELLEDFADLEETQKQLSLPLKLENHLRRRASAPPLRRRRVTLAELIEQIEQIAAEMGKTAAPPRASKPRPHSHREAARLVAQLAHDENLTELSTELEQFLLFKLPDRGDRDIWIDLEQLLEWWTARTFQALDSSPAPNQSHDRVGVFWALLLLSSQSKVELFQEEFYKDIKIKPIES